MAEKIKVTALHQSYKRLSEIIGVEAMLKVYNEYRGTQFQYPMRLYDREEVSKLVCQEYNGANLKELSQKYGYSQRWMKAQLNKQKQINNS